MMLYGCHGSGVSSYEAVYLQIELRTLVVAVNLEDVRNDVLKLE